VPRIARVAAAGVPQHVTQRGNKRQQTFFSDPGRRFQWGLLDRNDRRKVSTRGDWADALRDPLIEADEMGRSGERRKAAVRWAWTRSWKGP